MLDSDKTVKWKSLYDLPTYEIRNTKQYTNGLACLNRKSECFEVSIL